jgi:hypothetical protein
LPEDHAVKVKLAVQERGAGKHSQIKVTLRDKTEVKGYISQIGPDSFQLTNNKTRKATWIEYRDVEKVRKPGLSTGAKIAIAAGVAGVVVLVSIASTIASNEGY